ncbi:hypothetical protein T09_3620 [Trichinella sp. T9]|nr:hypothetical protein T09_3620 [Trichinella sp. T9]
MSLVYEDRAYKLKYTGKRRKGWECSKDKKWCKDSVSTNLDVTSMLRQIPHMDTCPMDPHFRIFYLNKKSAILFTNQKANLILIFGVKSKLSISTSEQNRLPKSYALNQVRLYFI